jgi:hypothetical protein
MSGKTAPTRMPAQRIKDNTRLAPHVGADESFRQSPTEPRDRRAGVAGTSRGDTTHADLIAQLIPGRKKSSPVDGLSARSHPHLKWTLFLGPVA